MKLRLAFTQNMLGCQQDKGGLSLHAAAGSRLAGLVGLDFVKRSGLINKKRATLKTRMARLCSMAGILGIEPRLQVPKTRVLPLDDIPRC